MAALKIWNGSEWVTIAGGEADLSNHISNDGTDHSNVVLNDTHRLGDGSDHSLLAAAAGTASANLAVILGNSLELDMQFGDRTNPGVIDGSIDPTAITDLSETLYWTLNGVLTNTTGGADLVEQSGPTAPAYCDRGTFKAWQGDGTLYFKASGVQGPLGSDARTTLAWVKTDETVSTNQRILEYGTGTGRWDFLFQGTMETMTVVGGGGNIATSNTNSKITDGEWHLLAVTLASGGAWSDIKFWIDGVDIGLDSSTGSTVNTLTNTDIWIGARSTGATPMQECMGLVAVFNDDLNATELLDIYTRQKTKFIGGSDNSAIDWTPKNGGADSDFETSKSGTFGEDLDVTGDVTFGTDLFVTGDTILFDRVVFSNLPISEPATSGEIWNDAGTIKIKE